MQDNYERVKYSKHISTIVRINILEYIAKTKLLDCEIEIIKLTFALSRNKMSLSEIMDFLNVSKNMIDKTLRNLFMYFRDTKVGEYIGEVIYGFHDLTEEKHIKKKTQNPATIGNIIEYLKSPPFNTSKEVINIIISTLSLDEMSLLKKCFGENLQSLEAIDELSTEELKKIKYIFSKIEKRVLKSNSQMLNNQEYLISLASDIGLKKVELILRIMIDEEHIRVLKDNQSKLVYRDSNNEYKASDSILNINKQQMNDLISKTTLNQEIMLPLEDILYFLSMFIFGSLPIECQRRDLFIKIYNCLDKNLKYLECLSVYYELKLMTPTIKKLCHLFSINKSYIEDATIKFFDTAKYIIECIKNNQREFKDVPPPPFKQ